MASIDPEARTNLRTVGAFALTVALAGSVSAACAEQPAAVHAATIAKPSPTVPEWVLRLPRREGRICATGAVDPTFYRQDGRTSAAEAARAELSRTVEIKIASVMVDEQTTRGSHVDQAIVSDVVGSVSEAVIRGAEVVEYWFDDTGAVSRNGMTYALACMSTEASVAELADRMKAALPGDENRDRIARVSERAKAAFDELDAAEEKTRRPRGPPVRADGGASSEGE